MESFLGMDVGELLDFWSNFWWTLLLSIAIGTTSICSIWFFARLRRWVFISSLIAVCHCRWDISVLPLTLSLNGLLNCLSIFIFILYSTLCRLPLIVMGHFKILGYAVFYLRSLIFFGNIFVLFVLVDRHFFWYFFFFLQSFNHCLLI
jgi:hypothetical protein